MKIQPNNPNQAHVLSNYAPESQNHKPMTSPDLGNQGPAVKPEQGDKAEISTRAHEILELRQAVDVGRSALAREPEVRADKVAQVRERLGSGFYHSAEIRDQVAGKLSTMFMDHPLF